MNKRIDERDELLLSRLLDGDLTEREETELKARIEREPDLRTSRDALTRLNDALVARRSDVPKVDWGRFRSRVMDSIEVQASSAKVIRFPRWLRVAAPLAAAAVLALMVVLSRPHGTPENKGGGVKPIDVAQVVPPTVEPGGSILVKFDRPSSPTTPRPTVVAQAGTVARSSVIQVSYVQSTELQEATRQIDKARENEPSWRVYTAHGSASSPISADMLETPPL